MGGLDQILKIKNSAAKSWVETKIIMKIWKGKKKYASLETLMKSRNGSNSISKQKDED